MLFICTSSGTFGQFKPLICDQSDTFEQKSLSTYLSDADNQFSTVVLLQLLGFWSLFS